jgi:RNA polymerase sigma-70 factor (ECF subfamily)
MAHEPAGSLTRARREPSAFGGFYAAHARGLLAFFATRTFDVEVARDLTAETFAQAWLSRDRFSDERDGSALPWLLGIGRNVLRESARRDSVETRARERLGLPLEVGTDDGFDEVDERLSAGPSLAEALQALPTHERAALELRVVAELPYDEVADRLAVRPAAARLRVSRALRRLALLTPKEEL